MHFNVQIDVKDKPITFHFEPSSTSETEPGFHVHAEKESANYDFRMSKANGKWQIVKESLPQWIEDCEPQLAKAIAEREYPQEV